MVHCSLGQQAQRAAQLYRAHPEDEPVQKKTPAKGQAAEAIEEGCLRRSGVANGPALCSHLVLGRRSASPCPVIVFLVRMYAIGPKRTCQNAQSMVAIGGS